MTACIKMQLVEREHMPSGVSFQRVFVETSSSLLIRLPHIIGFVTGSVPVVEYLERGELSAQLSCYLLDSTVAQATNYVNLTPATYPA